MDLEDGTGGLSVVLGISIVFIDRHRSLRPRRQPVGMHEHAPDGQGLT